MLSRNGLFRKYLRTVVKATQAVLCERIARKQARVEKRSRPRPLAFLQRLDMAEDPKPPPQHQEHQPGSEQKMDPDPETIYPGYHGSGKLDGRRALITGGDSGIGRAVAVHFAREGADVAIVYLDEDEDAQETKDWVEKEGQQCVVIPGDVAEKSFCQAAVDEAVSELGSLDILVNNAAQQYVRQEITDISEEQLDRTFRTNIYAYFFMVQAARPHLEEGDAIINSTSVTAFEGHPGLLDYSSTKGAILAFSRALSGNLVEDGIRVNAVAPGPIWTPLIPASFGEEQVEDFGRSTPMGRPGQPEEVAPSYVFLASEDASYMAGQTLHPNGGKVVGG
jgi:NAD(P)-dependent dehydrogenase (short-subunit alcohol dehydrogenase family)